MINGMQLSGYQNVSGNFSDSVDRRRKKPMIRR